MKNPVIAGIESVIISRLKSFVLVTDFALANVL